MLLVDPAKDFYAEQGAGKVIKQTPNIGLAYLGSVLQECGHDVAIADLPVSKHNFTDILKAEQPDTVGISAMTFNIKDAYHVAETVKRYNSKIYTVIGGPHPSARAHEVLAECKSLDVVVEGEGEITFQSLLTTRKFHGVIKGKSVEDLNMLPFPDWGLFDYQQNYARAYCSRYGDMRYVYPIITSRGCPFNCVFCYPHYLGGGVRFRSPKNVVEEMEKDMFYHSARYFYFADSNFNLKSKRTEKLCKQIITHDLHKVISWKAQTNVRTAKRSTFEFMRKAGCELIFFGIESGNEETQRKIRKHLTKDLIRKAVDKAKNAGLEVRASFIVGLPFDTKRTLAETLRFARSLHLDVAVFHILDVYAGTELDDMLREGEGGMRQVADKVSRGSVMVEVNDLDEATIKSYAEEGNNIVYCSFLRRLHRYSTELLYYRRYYPRVYRKYLKRVAPQIGKWLENLC